MQIKQAKLYSDNDITMQTTELHKLLSIKDTLPLKCKLIFIKPNLFISLCCKLWVNKSHYVDNLIKGEDTKTNQFYVGTKT